MAQPNNKTRNDIFHFAPQEYPDVMTRAGQFSDAAPLLDHDPRIWHVFFELCRDYADVEMDTELSLHLNKYAFCKAPVDADRAGQNFACVTSMVDPHLSVTHTEFISDLPALTASLKQSGEHIHTDSFCFQGGYGTPTQNPHMAWIHSPIATFQNNFGQYIDGLSSERRKKFRRMERDFAEHDVIFHLSQDNLTPQEIEFARAHLIRKWGNEEGLWALTQTLWSVACARIRPNNVYFMRATSGGELVFVQTLLEKESRVYCQSIFKNEDMFFDGIAPYTDFKCVEAMTGKGFISFDPSCRCSLDDPPSIGIAKRVTVNTDCLKPVFICGGALTDEQKTIMSSGEYFGKPA